jgi:recombinational DNA repair protein (RecF pathway)
LFYGGQGGGKKMKPTTLELGRMLRIELGQSKSTNDLYRAKEWQVVWSHESIRYNHKAFSLMCLFLEVVGSLSIEDDLHDELIEDDKTMIGLFRVLSNALVHLESGAKEKSNDSGSELLIFLGKMLIEQGVFPSREGCAFCDAHLEKLSSIYLVTDHGGFACSECVGHLEGAVISSPLEGRELWELLGVIANQRYQDLKELKMEHQGAVRLILHYFLYQFQFEEHQFKSLKMVL